MPELSVAAKNAALAGIGCDTASLHTVYNPLGGSEVVGGSPAYARQPITLTTSDGDSSLATPITFNVPAATTVLWVGFWDVSSVFLGMAPLYSLSVHMYALESDLTTLNLALNPALGNGRTVVVWAGPGMALPRNSALTHVNEGTMYYVVNATTSSVQLSTTLGGTALVFTAATAGYLQEISGSAFPSQGTLSIFNLSINALAGP